VPPNKAIWLRDPIIKLRAMMMGCGSGVSTVLFNPITIPLINPGAMATRVPPAPHRTIFRNQLSLMSAPAAARMIPKSHRPPYSNLRPPPTTNPKPTTMSINPAIP